MLICRPDDYPKANYQKCYCHNYFMKTMKIFKSTFLVLIRNQHEDTKYYDKEV